MIEYTHNEFLFEKQQDKIQFSVDQHKNRAEVESKLPSGYKASEAAAKGIAIMLLVLALPVFLVLNWFWAALCVAGGMGFFVYSQSFNYRVFVRASVKQSENFYDYCVKNNVITIYETNRGQDGESKEEKDSR